MVKSRWFVGDPGTDRRRRPVAAMALLLIVGLLAGACGGPGSQGGQSGSPAPAASDFKATMILSGPVEDADYNFIGYEAIQAVERELGIETSYQERVAPADAVRVSRGFINSGFNIVAYHGGQYLTTVKELAPLLPDANFTIETAGPVEDLPDNVWVIGRKHYLGYYVLGALGAKASRTGKVGVILGIELPEYIASVNAIRQAVRDHNPNAEVVYTFTGDQNDPVAGRQAAEAQINAGVDFIISQLDLGTTGIIEAIKGKDVLMTSRYTDKYQLAPENFTASLLYDFGQVYVNVIGRILEGQRSGYEEMRVGNGVVLSEIRNVPDEVVAEVEDIFQKVADGEIEVAEDFEMRQ